MAVKANDLKKGVVGYLKNGWKFEVYDNKKGSIRLAKVYGFCTEIGSIYIKDIDYVLVDGKAEKIELTKSQAKAAAAIAAAGF